MSIQRFLISAVLLAGACAVPASATLLTYTDPGTFATATGSNTFININFGTGSLGTSTTEDGVVFSTSGSGLTGEVNIANWPSGSALVSNAGVNTLTITFPAGVDGIDFYAGPQDFSLFTITLSDSSGGNFSSGAFHQPFVTPTTGVFFGATTTSSFTTLTITSQASPDQTTLDAVQIADAPPVAEAATFLMVGGGLVVLGFARRRFPRRASA